MKLQHLLFLLIFTLITTTMISCETVPENITNSDSNIIDNTIEETPPKINHYEEKISNFDSEAEGWLSNGSTSYINEGSLSGTPFMQVEAFGDTVIYKSFALSPIDISVYGSDGILHIDLYIEDASVIYGGQIELTSSGGSDSNEYHWGELGTEIQLNNGWNSLELPLTSMKEQNGAADLGNINYIRIYLNSASNVKLAIDNTYVYMNTEKILTDISFSAENAILTKKYFVGTEVDLNEIKKEFEIYGGDIVSWISEKETYSANDIFTVTNSAVITAKIKPWKKISLIYSDGNEIIEGISDYEGTTVKLEACKFKKEGYTFAGWKANDGNIYKAGRSYMINAENNTLTAVWKEIKDKELLSDAQEAWELCEGGVEPIANSAIGGADGELKWTVWLNTETFGQVLDFSTKGSVMTAKNVNIDLTNNFAISAWIKAPIRDLGIKTIVASGNKWSLILDKNGNLSFTAEGLSESSAVEKNLVDGKWHHILVSKENEILTYYIDGLNAKQMKVEGIVQSEDYITIGANNDGIRWFDGSLAQVRIYGKSKTPNEVTNITIVESDNTVKSPVFNCFHGITTDRSQGFGTEGGVILSDDVKNCKKMGFEFIRMMIYVDNLIDEGGKLNEEYINWSVDFINTIIDNGMPCMISLGCGNREAWNKKYLGTNEGFEDLVVFFGELTEWINAQGWTEEEISLLMFTEPTKYLENAKWTWMSDRLCAAVRNVDPEMTIITSSEETGNIEYIKKMIPVTDDNVVYSFTSYEPFTIGFNSFNDYGVADSWWHYIKDIPYPIQEGIDYTEAIEYAISGVPEEQKENARKTLNLYVQGVQDVWRKNPYKGTLYNGDWLMNRAQKLHEWSEKYGGIHLFVAEFGACDYIANTNLGAHKGSGLNEETRLRLISDSVKAYDAYGIGWSFWQYNESFSIYKPEIRKPYWCVSEAEFESHVYKELLDALGMNYDKELIK